MANDINIAIEQIEDDSDSDSDVTSSLQISPSQKIARRNSDERFFCISEPAMTFDTDP